MFIRTLFWIRCDVILGSAFLPQVIRKMGQYLKMSVTVPEEYLQGFVKANNTFLYQLVFDPLQRKVVPLNPYPEDLDRSTLSYAGLYPPSVDKNINININMNMEKQPDANSYEM